MLKITYYSRIMLNAFWYLLFPKLCQHNPPNPSERESTSSEREQKLSSSEASTAGHLHSSSSLKVGASQGHKTLNLSSRSNRIILFNLPEASLMKTKSAIDEIAEYLIVVMVRRSMQFVLDDINLLAMIQLLLDLGPYLSLWTVIGIRGCSCPSVETSKDSLLIRGSFSGPTFLLIILKGLIGTLLRLHTNLPNRRQLMSYITLKLIFLMLVLLIQSLRVQFLALL